MAFFLLVIFSQKVGMGMFLHEMLHTTRVAGNNSHPDQKDKEISFNCSCLDDLQMPFIGEEETVVPVILTVHQPLISFYKETISFHSSIFSSLRGPPAGTL